MNRKFKTGNVVQYVKGATVRKSRAGVVVEGGQRMKVGDPGPINLGGYRGVKLRDNFVDKVGCDWVDADGKAQSGKFLESELLLLEA